MVELHSQRENLEIISPYSKRRINRNYFYNINEYKVPSNKSDENLSDTQCSEAGYISDSSVSSRQTYDNGNRRRHTKQELNSFRKSQHNDIISDGDASLPHLNRPKYKKPRKKSLKEKLDDIPSTESKKPDEKNDIRQSWTDSGVSLSRTDQSHSGTMQTEYSFCKSKYHQRTKSYGSSGTDDKSSMKETDLSENTNNNEPNKVLIPSIEIEKASLSSGDGVYLNRNAPYRCSILTDRSSLTNVTAISNINSTAVLADLGCVKDIQIAEIQDNETHKDNYEIKSNKAVISNCNSFSENNINSIHPKSNTSTNEYKSYNNISYQFVHQPRKKSKSFLEFVRKAKNQMKPRLFNDKSYKDVSTEFSFEKTKTDVEIGREFQQITDNVLQELKDFKISADKKLIEFTENLKKKDVPSEENILDRLSKKPSKSKNIFGRMFRRTRSYVAQPTRNSSHNIQSFRNKTNTSSLPDIYLASTQERRQKNSLSEHINSDSNNQQKINNITNPNNSIVDRKFLRSTSLTELPHVYEKNNNKNNNAIRMHRTSSTPNTPIMMNRPRSEIYRAPPDNFGEIENNFRAPSNSCRYYDQRMISDSFDKPCECDECAYSEYLDFLAFQEFKKNKQYYRKIMQGEMLVHNQHEYAVYDNTNVNSKQWSCRNEPNGVVAPLNIVTEKKGEAKQTKTPVYNSFV